MATATVTRLNSKLPTVTKIAFCTSAGKYMSTTLYTAQNGKFTRKVGFKQNSTTYPFQIQYRNRSRYTPAYAKRKGASWTNWTNWKNAVAVTGIPIDAIEATKPINKWMKANKGVNKNGSYQTFYDFNAYMIPQFCDARQFEYRIRTINKSQAMHGSFTSQVLSVYKRAAVVDQKIITASDGGIKIKFNYIWYRQASIAVNSIKDSQGRELLRKPYTVGVQRTVLNQNTTPAARSGYFAGIVVVDIAKLKRKVSKNQALTLDVQFVTCDNAITPFTSGVVLEPTRNINVAVNHTWYQDRGLLKVQAVNNDSIALTDIGCNVSYTYNSKSYSISALNVTKNLTGTSTFYFYPPIGIPISIHVKEQDADDFKDKEDIAPFTVNASGYRLNKIDSTSICGIAWGRPSFTINSQPQYQTDLPYGRTRNVIFYGNGNNNTIQLTASIVDKDNCYGGSYARKQAWDKIQNNQGLYIFRTNRGQLYKVGVIGVDMKHNTKDIYDIQVSMVEVV